MAHVRSHWPVRPIQIESLGAIDRSSERDLRMKNQVSRRRRTSTGRPASTAAILVTTTRSDVTRAGGFFGRLQISPILRIGEKFFGVFMLASVTACASSPASPTGPPPAGSTIVYAAVGGSDVTGVGSSVACLPYTDCPNGTGYAFVAARELRGRGFTVNVTNMGIPTGVISRTFQDMGVQLGRIVLGNFIDQAAPFVSKDSTLITVFAGANEVNIITGAMGNGAGASDPAGYIDQQVKNFSDDYARLMAALRTQALSARFVLLNVPNVAGMPFLSTATLPQRQAAQRAAVRMSTTVINPLASSSVTVIDLLCDARLYDRGNYSSDGFHPNDAGYAAIGGEVARAVTGSYPAPQGSCSSMAIVP